MIGTWKTLLFWQRAITSGWGIPVVAGWEMTLFLGLLLTHVIVTILRCQQIKHRWWGNLKGTDICSPSWDIARVPKGVQLTTKGRISEYIKRLSSSMHFVGSQCMIWISKISWCNPYSQSLRLFHNLRPSVNWKTPTFRKVRAQHISWGQVFHPYAIRSISLSFPHSVRTSQPFFSCSVLSSVFHSSDPSVFPCIRHPSVHL